MELPTRLRVAQQLQQLLIWLGTPRPFTVFLWWRDDPRRITATEWPSRRTVNGGWTSAGASAICVYRSEEWDRVVLHEMIHALEWDWHHMPAKALSCWGLPAKSQLTPALFEAWTELLAEWLWCHWYGVPWSKQRAWQDYQAVQILARAGSAPWRENTSVWAYYVLKAALAPSISKYLRGPQWTMKERETVLCERVEPVLASLRARAAQTRPEALSLSMTLQNPAQRGGGEGPQEAEDLMAEATRLFHLATAMDGGEHTFFVVGSMAILFHAHARGVAIPVLPNDLDMRYTEPGALFRKHVTVREPAQQSRQGLPGLRLQTSFETDIETCGEYVDMDVFRACAPIIGDATFKKRRGEESLLESVDVTEVGWRERRYTRTVEMGGVRVLDIPDLLKLYELYGGEPWKMELLTKLSGMPTTAL